MTEQDEQHQPLLRVVKGDPQPEEVAALVAVVSALASADLGDTTPRPRSAWSDPTRRLRTPLPHGPGAWRASALGR